MSPSTTRETSTVTGSPAPPRIAAAVLRVPVPEQQHEDQDEQHGDAARADGAAPRHGQPPFATGHRYGVRVTLETIVSLICSTISIASFHSRCQTLRP